MPAPATRLHTLPNGVRVLTVHLPHLASASVSVFVRAGSVHERRLHNGTGHVVEHMVFKGTRERDRRRINLEAERLGAEVNAHTDKDHTAFHMRGLAADVEAFIGMLADLVQNATFPLDELERERQVLLAEFAEDEDDAMSLAFKLFDRACFGLHPFAQPVIGTRRVIERFTRAELAEYVRRHYTGTNVVVAAAGPFDGERIAEAAGRAFAALPAGEPNIGAPAPYRGGLASRHVAGTGQAHLVLGGAVPGLDADDATASVAAAVLGEGMSSPLMETLREERGLVYYAACSADVFETAGQFVVEASMDPRHLDECLTQALRLIDRHARAVDPVDLERARHQLRVRRLRAQERPARLLEEAALDLFALGRVRTPIEREARIEDVGAAGVREHFGRLIDRGISVAVTGQVGRGVRDRVAKAVASLGR